MGCLDASAQQKKEKTVESKHMTEAPAGMPELSKTRGQSKEGVAKSRGPVYGDNLSDIIIDNWTPWYIDIYVDGEFRGFVEPWDEGTTWAIPGNTRLYGVAEFDDGDKYYWGPTTVETGYEFTWKLNE